MTLGFDLGIPEIFDLGIFPVQTGFSGFFLVVVSAHFFLVGFSAHFVPIPPFPILLGQSLTVARSSSTICAVMAMRDYFLLARPQPGLLFYFQSGRYLTRGVVSHLLQDSARFAGLPYLYLKGHSFRIGAASVAAAAGLPLDTNLWFKSAWSLVVRLLPAVHQNSAVSLAFSCP